MLMFSWFFFSLARFSGVHGAVYKYCKLSTLAFDFTPNSPHRMAMQSIYKLRVSRLATIVLEDSARERERGGLRD
jgi:hypothetical protein